jgi:anti-sigma B factor antagonist
LLGGELVMGYSQPQTRLAVVRLPAGIDGSNAREEGRDLLAAVVPGVTAVIADMTATTFCGSSGVQMVALVHELAVANQAKLVLVVPSAAVPQVLSLSGLDVLLPVYPSLDEALSAVSVPKAGAAS